MPKHSTQLSPGQIVWKGEALPDLGVIAARWKVLPGDLRVTRSGPLTGRRYVVTYRPAPAVILPPVVWAPSPNHYSAPLSPTGIVMHETEGSYAGAVSWFGQARSQVSAHLVLREDGGEVTQCVPFLLPAWHAVNANDHTIGIELAGFTALPNDPRQLAAAARIIGYLCRRYSIPARQGDAEGRGGIVRHRDLGAYGGNHSDPGGFDWPTFVETCAAAARNDGYPPAWGREHA